MALKLKHDANTEKYIKLFNSHLKRFLKQYYPTLNSNNVFQQKQPGNKYNQYIVNTRSQWQKEVDADVFELNDFNDSLIEEKAIYSNFYIRTITIPAVKAFRIQEYENFVVYFSGIMQGLLSSLNKQIKYDHLTKTTGECFLDFCNNSNYKGKFYYNEEEGYKINALHNCIPLVVKK